MSLFTVRRPKLGSGEVGVSDTKRMMWVYVQKGVDDIRGTPVPGTEY